MLKNRHVWWDVSYFLQCAQGCSLLLPYFTINCLPTAIFLACAIKWYEKYFLKGGGWQVKFYKGRMLEYSWTNRTIQGTDKHIYRGHYLLMSLNRIRVKLSKPVSVKGKWLMVWPPVPRVSWNYINWQKSCQLVSQIRPLFAEPIDHSEKRYEMSSRLQA